MCNQQEQQQKIMNVEAIKYSKPDPFARPSVASLLLLAEYHRPYRSF